MGVDYRHCESCKESRYDEYVGSCVECGSSLCTNCLVNNDISSNYAHHYGIRFDSSNEVMVKELLADGCVSVDEEGNYDISEGELIDDSAILAKYCPFCQGKEINKDEVLNYILEKYNLKIEDVWSEMRKE